MKRHLDRKIILKTRRFADAEIKEVARKVLDLIKKAASWCKSKIDEYPILKKVIRVLLKMYSAIQAIEAGLSVGRAASLKIKAVSEANDRLMEQYGVKFSALGVLLHGISAALKSAAAWTVAKKAMS